jgi:hypothetical protein
MIDIALTGDLDLMIANGDFTAAESTPQHQKLLLLATTGDFMQYPTSGVGIQTFLNDERDDMMTEIRSQFEKDGMKVSSLHVNGSKIEIDARYK